MQCTSRSTPWRSTSSLWWALEAPCTPLHTQWCGWRQRGGFRGVHTCRTLQHFHHQCRDAGDKNEWTLSGGECGEMKKIVSARCSLKIQAVQLMVVQGFVADSSEIETHILRIDVIGSASSKMQCYKSKGPSLINDAAQQSIVPQQRQKRITSCIFNKFLTTLVYSVLVHSANRISCNTITS